MNSDTAASQWAAATITNIITETPTVKTFTFRLPRKIEHRAGQHYEIRLTSPDGYQAARLYSAASAAKGDDTLQLTIALLKGGEVSPYMHNGVSVGDQVEIRGPLGKFFIWESADTSPVLMIAGGSGVVPMRCIFQAHLQSASAVPITLLYSARDYDEIIYKDELLQPADPAARTIITLSDDHPADWQGATGRIDSERIKVALQTLPPNPSCYVCGATPFVEAMATLLIDMGIPVANIKAERFGAAA